MVDERVRTGPHDPPPNRSWATIAQERKTSAGRRPLHEPSVAGADSPSLDGQQAFVHRLCGPRLCGPQARARLRTLRGHADPTQPNQPNPTGPMDREPTNGRLRLRRRDPGLGRVSGCEMTAPEQSLAFPQPDACREGVTPREREGQMNLGEVGDALVAETPIEAPPRVWTVDPADGPSRPSCSTRSGGTHHSEGGVDWPFCPTERSPRRPPPGATYLQLEYLHLDSPHRTQISLSPP